MKSLFLLLLSTTLWADDYSLDFKPSPSTGIAYYQVNASTTLLGTTNVWVNLRRLTNAPLVSLTNSYTGEIYSGIVTTFTNQPTYLAFSVTAVSTNGGNASTYGEPLFVVKNLRIRELP